MPDSGSSGVATLAIHGGAPVRTTLLPYGHQTIGEDDVRAVVDALRSDLITTGPKVAEFEEALAACVGAAHAVTFSSGTAALHGAAFAAGLEPGDEAITTPMTFCATSNCVLYQGARPVFADVCPDTLNLDPDEAARKITQRTRVLIPVDFAGHPADLDAFRALSDAHGLIIIEDASHALGAEYRARRVGSLSHMSVFSLHPVKHVTTGEGGVVTTNDDTLAHRLRIFRNHGIDSDARHRQARHQWYYEMVALGFNYRLTDLQCALGLSQLPRLPAWLRRRQEIAGHYTYAFGALPGVRPLAVRSDVFHAYHLYVIRLDPARLSCDREAAFVALRAEGIGVNVHYIPVHLHPYYRAHCGTAPGLCPIAEAAYEQILSLPIFPGMSDEDVADVVTAVSKVVRAYAG